MAPSATSPAAQTAAAARAAAAHAEAKNNQAVDKKADQAWQKADGSAPQERKSGAADAQALGQVEKKELSPDQREHYVRTCLGDSEFAKTAKEYDDTKAELLALKAAMPQDLAKKAEEIKNRPFYRVKEANGEREPLLFGKHRKALLANIDKEYAERIRTTEQRLQDLNKKQPVQTVRYCGVKLQQEGYLEGEITFNNVQAALLDKDIGVAPKASQEQEAPQAAPAKASPSTSTQKSGTSAAKESAKEAAQQDSAQIPDAAGKKSSSPQPAEAEKAEAGVIIQRPSNPWEVSLTRQEAEKLNEYGKELYGKNQYREAAGIFKDLYNKTGQSKYLANAAYAYEALGDDFAARKLAKEYVSLAGVSEKDKKEMNARVGSIEGRLPVRSLNGLSPEFLKPDTLVHVKETYKHYQTGELMTEYHSLAAADVYKFDESKNPPLAVGIFLASYVNNEITFEDPTTGRTQQATVKVAVGEEIPQLTFSKPQAPALPIDEAGRQYDQLLDEAAPIHKKIAELSAKKSMLESALKSSKNKGLNNNLQKQITSLQAELKVEQDKVVVIQKRMDGIFEKNPELKKLLATDYQHYDYNGRLSAARYQGVKDYILGESRDKMRQIASLVESDKGQEAKDLAIQFYRQTSEPDYLIYYMSCKSGQYKERKYPGTKGEVVKAKSELINGVLDDFEVMSKLGLSPQVKSELIARTYSARPEDLDSETSGRLLKIQKENMDSSVLGAAARYSHDDLRALDLGLRALEVAKNEEERKEALSFLAIRTAYSIIEDKDLSWKDFKDLRAKVSQVPGLSQQDKEAALKEMDQVFVERARELSHQQFSGMFDDSKIDDKEASSLPQMAKNFEEIYNLSSEYDDLHNAVLLYGDADQKDAHFIQLLDKAIEHPQFNKLPANEKQALTELKNAVSK